MEKQFFFKNVESKIFISTENEFVKNEWLYLSDEI